jgi:hypothetical protein
MPSSGWSSVRLSQKDFDSSLATSNVPIIGFNVHLPRVIAMRVPLQWPTGGQLPANAATGKLANWQLANCLL